MSDEIVVKTCSFNLCRQCKDGCCQDAKPPLTLERKKIIEDYLKEQKIHVEHPFVNEAYSFPAVDAMGFCVFYGKGTRKCLVHPVKPETCRVGPVTFDINCRTRKVEWYLKTAEICAFAEELRQNEEAFKEHFKVAKEAVLRLICEIDSVALCAIMQVEEPQTFKIGEDDLPKEVMAKLKLS